jgi:hypothetical protein
VTRPGLYRADGGEDSIGLETLRCRSRSLVPRDDLEHERGDRRIGCHQGDEPRAVRLDDSRNACDMVVVRVREKKRLDRIVSLPRRWR